MYQQRLPSIMRNDQGEPEPFSLWQLMADAVTGNSANSSASSAIRVTAIVHLPSTQRKVANTL
jgi:hypothetical protein